MRLARRATVVVLGLALAGCGMDPCGNTPLLSVPSPDGDQVAVVFARDCGATTAFSTQMSILPASDPASPYTWSPNFPYPLLPAKTNFKPEG